MQDLIRSLAGTIEALDSYVVRGRIVAVRGLMAEASGVAARTALGDHVRIRLRDGGRLAAEVVGFRGRNGCPDPGATCCVTKKDPAPAATNK